MHFCARDYRRCHHILRLSSSIKTSSPLVDMNLASLVHTSRPDWVSTLSESFADDDAYKWTVDTKAEDSQQQQDLEASKANAQAPSTTDNPALSTEDPARPSNDIIWDNKYFEFQCKMRSLEDEITRRLKGSPYLFAQGRSPAEENLRCSVFAILQQDPRILREINFEKAATLIDSLIQPQTADDKERLDDTRWLQKLIELHGEINGRILMAKVVLLVGTERKSE